MAAVLDGTAGPGTWWFIRKHPGWRLRVSSAADALTGALDKFVDAGVLDRWWSGSYEPETAAFGGPAAMTAAHTLFAADSHAVLRRGADLPVGARELSMLLCGALLAGARLEPYEMGDVWAKAAAERPLPEDVGAGALDRLAGTVGTLLRTDAGPEGAAFGPSGPLADAAPWARAFFTCGRALADLAAEGILERGLRSVLAYHVLFHWNRLGLAFRQQSLLAHAARSAVLGPAPTAPNRPARRRSEHPQPDGVYRFFPLVPRPRLICPPLADRLRGVADHADAAMDATDPEERIDRACGAWNLAALIAADSGLPGLAADLCWRQHHVLRRLWPLPGRAAIAALQPLVNLARLHGRARRPHLMYEALTGIARTLNNGVGIDLHNTRVTLDGFTTDTSEARAWYREVLAQDGTRALAATGDWSRAAAHAALHDTDPDRLHEARQTRVVAELRAARTDSARAFIDSAHPADRGSPCGLALHALIDTHAETRDDHLPSYVDALIRELPSNGEHTDPSSAFWHVRLTHVADALGSPPELLAPLWRRLADDILTANDAYAARAALATPSCPATLPPDTSTALSDLLHHAALDSPPPTVLPSLTALSEPLTQALTALTRT
ncbi:thiopeptide-type bacteriocin biosynthesis protein [Actinocorallia sp. API 0066]|uniref:thiopeptide-type bacteriocin biosynthesis protein n=1 Tax=Actinocorallia sp. API 0066 TaxID=2896846 RepID=UPI001E2E70C9|nr:thiopeptide-type bacteriocin biosynthesis protein [Actinocorallia sp. API 0066]MCD0449331.1 thiopeptide-type bacteriocin biosynthesis protein [Actinocorallia sp. API 0066]